MSVTGMGLLYVWSAIARNLPGRRPPPLHSRPHLRRNSRTWGCELQAAQQNPNHISRKGVESAWSGLIYVVNGGMNMRGDGCAEWVNGSRTECGEEGGGAATGRPWRRKWKGNWNTIWPFHLPPTSYHLIHRPPKTSTRFLQVTALCALASPFFFRNHFSSYIKIYTLLHHGGARPAVPSADCGHATAVRRRSC